MLLPLFMIYSVFRFPICSSLVLFLLNNHFRFHLVKDCVSLLNKYFTLITDKLELTGSKLSKFPRVSNSVLPLTKAEIHLLGS